MLPFPAVSARSEAFSPNRLPRLELNVVCEPCGINQELCVWLWLVVLFLLLSSLLVAGPLIVTSVPPPWSSSAQLVLRRLPSCRVRLMRNNSTVIDDGSILLSQSAVWAGRLMHHPIQYREAVLGRVGYHRGAKPASRRCLLDAGPTSNDIGPALSRYLDISCSAGEISVRPWRHRQS